MFRELRFDAADEASHPWSYQWVRRSLPQVPVFKALHDGVRGYTFYRIFVNGSEERPPGLCLLFVGNQAPVVLDIYEQRTYAGEGILDAHGGERVRKDVVLTLLLDALETPAGLQVTREEVLEIVMQAFWVEQAAQIPEVRPVRIHWAFSRGREATRSNHRFPL